MALPLTLSDLPLPLPAHRRTKLGRNQIKSEEDQLGRHVATSERPPGKWVLDRKKKEKKKEPDAHASRYATERADQQTTVTLMTKMVVLIHWSTVVWSTVWAFARYSWQACKQVAREERYLSSRWHTGGCFDSRLLHDPLRTLLVLSLGIWIHRPAVKWGESP